MDIQLAEQRLFVLGEKISQEQARARAMDKRVSLFVSGLGTLLIQRPKAEEIELIGAQKRFEPVWHVVCTTRHVYDRTRKINMPAGGPEVKTITLHGEDYPVVNNVFAINVLEHCQEENRQQMFFDALTGQAHELGSLIGGVKNEITDLANFTTSEAALIVPPEVRASYVVRQVMQPLLKPVQADVVLEESAAIEVIDLYYRPIYAFEFHWKPKDKTAVAEFDGVTGEMRNARALLQKMNIPISRDALFDIGADTVGMLIPGANIAVKLARVAIDRKK